MQKILHDLRGKRIAYYNANNFAQGRYVSKQTGIQKAIKKFEGSTIRLAEAVGGGIVRQNIEYWASTGVVPPEKCAAVHRASAVSLHELNPRMDWEEIFLALTADFEHAKNFAVCNTQKHAALPECQVVTNLEHIPTSCNEVTP